MDRPGTEPPYVRIVNEIRGRITAGELAVGDRVPSTRQITVEWGVAMATATKVLTALRQEGLVQARPGVGTVVVAPGSAGPAVDQQPGTTSRPAPRRAPREPDQGLTRDRIVQTAIEIADAEGLAALSMRRVAAQLGVATMALYRHVPSKDELVLLMTDSAFGEAALPAETSSAWRARLELIARLQWALCRRHPWVPQVMSFTRPMQSLHGMAHTDAAMAAVDGLNLDTVNMMHIAVSMAGYVHGMAVNLSGEVEAEHNSGLTSEQWWESQEQVFENIFASGRFPMLGRLLLLTDFTFGIDVLFEFGLQRMLDGFAVLIDNAQS